MGWANRMATFLFVSSTDKAELDVPATRAPGKSPQRVDLHKPLHTWILTILIIGPFLRGKKVYPKSKESNISVEVKKVKIL